jgi:hypothetical protein
MSNKPNCYFKTNKNMIANKANTKISERAHFQISSGVNPKKLENLRQIEGPFNISDTSENIVCLTPDSNQNIKKNLENNQEE